MDWTKVVTEPAGLAGFALSLMFGVLSARRGMPRWWPAAAAALAAASVVGGLFLAYKSLGVAPENAASAPVSSSVKSNEAVTSGDCSPTYAGVTVGGNMESSANCGAQPSSKNAEGQRK